MKPDTNLDNLLERAKQRSLRDNGWPHGTAYASNRKWRATYEVRKGTWQVFHYDTRLLVIYDAVPDDPESGVLVEPDYSSGLWSGGLSLSDKQGMNTILRHVFPRVTWQALAELDVPTYRIRNTVDNAVIEQGLTYEQAIEFIRPDPMLILELEVRTEPDEPLSLDRWQPPLRTEDIMGL